MVITTELKRYPIEIVTIENMTAGPAETVYIAIKKANVSGSVVVKDVDNYLKVENVPQGNFVAGLDLNTWERDIHNLRNKSFLILNEQGNLLDIIEKKVRSDVICLDLNGEPVEYVFACTVGNNIENCNIVLEELNSAAKNEKYSQVFNYFRCHDRTLGKGVFSSAVEKGKRNTRLRFNLNSKESLICQFKDILLNNARIYGNTLVRGQIQSLLYQIEEYFSQYSVYATSKFNTGKMRAPVSVKNLDSILSYDGANFTNVFNHYKSADIMWKSRFESFMKELIPNLQMVDTVTNYDNLIFKLVYGDEQYDLSDISEGTLKGLILNMLINMPMETKKSMLAIDEPENNLHPAWQKVIGNWIQTSENYEQCFISTHSPDFLDVFTEEFKYENVAVFVFDNNGTIKKITYADIADELGEWELGDLYRTNDPALGGWPW